MLAQQKLVMSRFGHLTGGIMCALLVVLPDNAHAQNSEDDVSEAWQLSPRFSFDVRTRYQNTTQSERPEGEALTLRFQLAGEIDLPRDTIFLAEVEGNIGLIDDFNDGTRNETGLPFIPDPDGFELNRLAIVSEAVDGVRVTAGRQRIALDDWRFIGAFPFRQNDQTFDAIRFETSSFGPGTLDVGYIGRVLRPLGFGRRHWEDFGLVWDFAYARQVDHAENPNDFETDYFLAELTVEPGSSGITLRAETLGSGDNQGFQTPLGSLHRFQGLSDQFLRTPDAGVRDISLLARHDFSSVGIFESVRVFARHHWFHADSNAAKYGTEWNASISAQYENVVFSLEYADYAADTFSVDTRSLFLTTQFRF